MGSLQFVVPPSLPLAPGALEQAYLTGFDGFPWYCRQRFEDGMLTFTRSAHESATVYLPWLLPNGETRVLSTATLMERETPYLLPLEIARGTLNRLRNQLAAWQQAGLNPASATLAEVDRAQHTLALAAIHRPRPEESHPHALETIEISCRAIDALASDYLTQALAFRLAQQTPLPTLLGVQLEANDARGQIDQQALAQLEPCANLIVLPLCWKQIETQAGQFDWSAIDRQVEACRAHGVKVMLGPIVQLDERHLPDWLYLWEDDLEALVNYVSQFAAAAVERYKGRVQLWHAMGRVNFSSGLALEEEQRLQLAVITLEAIRRADPRTPIVVGFDRPWGEYMGHEECDLAPYHYADALARAGLGLSGIGVEINFTGGPGASLPRDLLETSRLIDRWSLAGLPLLVMLASPPERAEPLARLMLCKQSVHGVVWNGPLDANRNDRQLLESLAKLRRDYLA